MDKREIGFVYYIRLVRFARQAFAAGRMTRQFYVKVKLKKKTLTVGATLQLSGNKLSFVVINKTGIIDSYRLYCLSDKTLEAGGLEASTIFRTDVAATTELRS